MSIKHVKCWRNFNNCQILLINILTWRASPALQQFISQLGQAKSRETKRKTKGKFKYWATGSNLFSLMFFFVSQELARDSGWRTRSGDRTTWSGRRRLSRRRRGASTRRASSSQSSPQVPLDTGADKMGFRILTWGPEPKGFSYTFSLSFRTQGYMAGLELFTTRKEYLTNISAFSLA